MFTLMIVVGSQIVFDENQQKKLHEIREKLDVELIDSSSKGYKSNSRVYRKVFNKTNRESNSIDPFGDFYFCSKPEDETTPVCVTLPKSLLKQIDNYCQERNIKRSRLVRKILEYSLDLD